ncbi:unnamed protein product [Paramecium sonneborni]|uniref:Uncharacterized protein n=1 Tax=Paramecium sonneborni TaxID=65129 RepID=A0A8S1RN29_9CILI|nr:unnamed protein product [Paramecium sonneborni]
MFHFLVKGLQIQMVLQKPKLRAFLMLEIDYWISKIPSIILEICIDQTLNLFESIFRLTGFQLSEISQTWQLMMRENQINQKILQKNTFIILIKGASKLAIDFDTEIDKR